MTLNANNALLALSFLSLLFIFSCNNAQNSPQQSAHSFYNQGSLNLKSKAYDEAIEDFNRAIQLKPNFIKAYHNRSIAYSEIGNIEAALKDLDKSLEIDSNDCHTYYYTGRIKHQQGDTKEAIKDFTHCLKKDPTFHPAYSDRATIYFSLKNYERAIKDYTEAINLYGSTKRYICRGNSYNAIGENQKAIADFKRAIQMGANNLQAHQELANTYMKLELYEEALPLFNKILDIDPKHSFSLLHRGIIKIKTGFSEEGCADLLKSHELGNKDAMIKLNNYCN
ncbi:tetratricopeptide repeat protein [Aureispira anguillae]|uniref:Tetratricopeptide repeat protein n=1 Tax=Aureispira anguillae TaxID=2864201 RepID=A0A915YE45_9BACT|nr:tetratricopeptide repeat protein [Aureispira anguillae]BDS11428.1 tetratricopeptide repeat protein [Aureispira anguillae]